jgi:hypothetical protein
MRMAIALVIAMLLPAPAMQASANPVEDIVARLSVAFSQAIEGAGTARSVSQTVTMVDRQGALTLNAPVGSQIRILEFRMFLCSAQQAAVQTTTTSTPVGCRNVISQLTGSKTETTFVQTRLTRGILIDAFSVGFPFLTPRVVVQDASGNTVSFFGDSSPWQIPDSSPLPPTAGSEYVGPLILGNYSTRGTRAGESVSFRGQKLDAVFAASIGSASAGISVDGVGNLTVVTPASLPPGIYDLVLQSRYGTLVSQNAIRIKAETPDKNIAFRGAGRYLNERQVDGLLTFRDSLTRDYEKVRCVVNAADSAVARSIATRVCANIARGELRNVEVTHEVRTTFKGSGFWVRVYATG